MWVLGLVSSHEISNWIVQQPWATGQVGMIGGSYLGFTQWLLAKEHPEALRAIAPR